MKGKVLSILIVILLVTMSLVWLIPSTSENVTATVSPSVPATLQTWQYRQSHNITNAAGAGSNYAKMVRTTYTAEGTTNGITNLLNITRLQATPILSVGDPGTWDSYNIHTFSIINDGSKLILFYGGQDDSAGHVVAIGRATSANTSEPPTNWTKFASNPILTNSTSGWDSTEHGVRMGNVIMIGSTFYLYYSSEADPEHTPSLPAAIGVATSTDGFNFTKYAGNPILEPDEVNDWACGVPHVIKVGATYYMYYTRGVYDAAGWTPSGSAVATSPDGLTWTRQATILSLGSAGAWDDVFIEQSKVYHTSDGYILAYEGYSGSEWKIGIATSSTPTGVFTKYVSNPILKATLTAGRFDQYHVATPLFYKMSNQLYLFYQGANDATYTSAHWNMGIASVANLAFLNSHSRTDFGDVRFTDSYGSLLKYWIESKTDGDGAIFWVNVSQDLTSVSRTIYLYYGNSGATTTSDGEGIFPLFDDFSAVAVNATMWDITNTVSVTAGEVTVAYNGGDSILSSKRTFAPTGGTYGYAFRSRTKLSGVSGAQSGSFEMRVDSTHMTRWIDWAGSYPNKQWAYQMYASSSIQLINSGITSPNYHVLEIRRFATNDNFFKIDGTEIHNPSSGVSVNAAKILTFSYAANAQTITDWVLVRKDCRNEPADFTWGAIESLQSSNNPESGASFLTADFTFKIQGNTVQFTDTSKGIGIYIWHWYFGDNKVSASQDPSHTYLSAGKYNVVLGVEDSVGNSDTVTKVVQIGESSGFLGFSFQISFVFGLALMVAGFLIIVIVRRPSAAVVGGVAIILGVLVIIQSL